MTQWNYPLPTDKSALRDWFAGQALISMIMEPGAIGEDTYRLTAEQSYRFADAMMKAREK